MYSVNYGSAKSKKSGNKISGHASFTKLNLKISDRYLYSINLL